MQAIPEYTCAEILEMAVRNPRLMNAIFTNAGMSDPWDLQQGKVVPCQSSPS